MKKLHIKAERLTKSIKGFRSRSKDVKSLENINSMEYSTLVT